MRARSGARLAVLAVAGAIVAVSAPAYASRAVSPAADATAVVVDHRAAVVVDTGFAVKTACVHFTEASITGKEALERADVDPVFASYGGTGVAVCALCGTGCSSGNCLTCDAQNYWAYHRAAAGATTYTYSQAGAGATEVHDGDVEGWRWGSGGPPPFFSIEQVCGVAATSTTSTTASAAATTSTPLTTVPPVATSTAPESGSTTTSLSTTTTSAETSSSVGGAAGEGGASSPAATATDLDAAPASSTGDGQADSAVGSVVGFLTALAVLGAIGWRARSTRRRRAAAGPGDPNR